ncbi:MAG: hypothetical protein CVT86_07960, partial [Alphaproteobacteria bacterium HGW-Alphaproteobacteria-8]
MGALRRVLLLAPSRRRICSGDKRLCASPGVEIATMSIAANRTFAPFGAITVFRAVTAVEALALGIGRAWRA